MAHERRGRHRKPPSPTMRRAPQGDEGTAIVDAIVTAAERVLETEGLDAFSTNRVAEVAGVSIGSLYRYFPNKFALARGVFERHLALYVRVIIDHSAGGGDVRAFVLRVGSALVEFFEHRRAIHHALWRLRSAAEIHERIASALEAMIATVGQVLRQAGVPAQRADDLAFVLVHASEGIANAVALRGDPVFARRTVDLVAELATALVARAD